MSVGASTATGGAGGAAATQAQQQQQQQQAQEGDGGRRRAEAAGGGAGAGAQPGEKRQVELSASKAAIATALEALRQAKNEDQIKAALEALFKVSIQLKINNAIQFGLKAIAEKGSAMDKGNFEIRLKDLIGKNVLHAQLEPELKQAITRVNEGIDDKDVTAKMIELSVAAFAQAADDKEIVSPKMADKMKDLGGRLINAVIRPEQVMKNENSHPLVRSIAAAVAGYGAATGAGLMPYATEMLNVLCENIKPPASECMDDVNELTQGKAEMIFVAIVSIILFWLYQLVNSRKSADAPQATVQVMTNKDIQELATAQEAALSAKKED